MAVTELALLHLKPPHALTPAICTVLAKAKAAMTSFTSKPFHILRQVEDPEYLYVLGTWPSREAHVETFIPSAANQSILADLADVLEVVWLHHLQAPTGIPVVPATGPVGEDKNAVLSISRHFVDDPRKAEFERVWAEKIGLLDDFTKAGTEALAGWSIEVEEGKAEFVLVLGWEAVEKHSEFGNSELGREYLGAVRAVLYGGEVKHAEVLEL
jgi:heme-degrading monooxygenase HmoA